MPPVVPLCLGYISPMFSLLFNDSTYLSLVQYFSFLFFPSFLFSFPKPCSLLHCLVYPQKSYFSRRQILLIKNQRLLKAKSKCSNSIKPNVYGALTVMFGEGENKNPLLARILFAHVYINVPFELVSFKK